VVGLGGGSVIDGFEIVRSLGGGSLGKVYEATQVSLDRRVALRVIDQRELSRTGAERRFRDQQRRAATFHHPSAVPTYEAGAWSGGVFVASRFIPGGTLATKLEERSLGRAELTRVLEQIADALAAAHQAGLVHGAVSADNVLVDAAGNGYIADLGLGREGTPAEDLARLATLRAEAMEGAAGRWRRRSAGVTLSVGVAAAGAIAALALGGAGSSTPVDAGLGCEPRPGPNAPLCTLIQGRVSGEQAVAKRSGVIRGWSVRGASGEMALQVVGRRGGEAFLRAFSRPEQVPASGVGDFETNLRVERGDLLGIVLAPGATIGVREGEAGSAIVRWEGAPPRLPQEMDGRLIAGRLLFGVDVLAGERPALIELTGRRAARATPGEVLGGTSVETATGETVSIDAVRAGGGVHLDLRRGGTRRVRLAVPDAEPGGTLIELDPECGFAWGFCFRWSNADGLPPILHAYRVRESALRPIG
jgi:hypothetical protein